MVFGRYDLVFEPRPQYKNNRIRYGTFMQNLVQIVHETDEKN